MTTAYKPYFSKYGFQSGQQLDLPATQPVRWGWNGTNYSAQTMYNGGTSTLNLDMQAATLSLLFGVGTGTQAYNFSSSTLNATGVTANFAQGTVTANPTTSMQLANKGYVDSVAQGLSAKPSVVCATTANITLSGTQTIDGVAVVAGNRVLVKNQTTNNQNGIYIVAAGAWTLALDFNTWTEIPGSFVFVEAGGTTLQNTGWICTAAVTGTLGTTAITWVQFSSAGAYTASNGLALTGNNFTLAGSPTISTGDLLIGAATAGNVVNLADVATGNALISGGVGVAPSWGKINLTAATHITGTLPIGNGGTGQTTALAGYDALAPTTTNGDFTYRGASTSARLAGNTTATKQFLSMTSSVPNWGTLVSGDIPDLSATYDTVGTVQTITAAKTFSALATLNGGFTSPLSGSVGTGTRGAWGTPYMGAGNGNIIAASGYAGSFCGAMIADSTNSLAYNFNSFCQVNGSASWICHFVVNAATLTSGSVAHEIGFNCPDLTLATGSTAAFSTSMTAGASKYAFYATGTAQSYFGGDIMYGTNAGANFANNAREQAATLTTTATTQVTMDSFLAANYRSAKWLIQVYDSVATNVHYTEIMAIRDASNNLYITENDPLYNSATLATFDVQYDGTSLICLKVTPASSNNTVFRSLRTTFNA